MRGPVEPDLGDLQRSHRQHRDDERPCGMTYTRYPTIHCARANGPGVGTLATNGAISQGEWWWDGHPETGLYNHVMTPNLWSCDDSNNSWVNDGAAATASSRHPGIVNVAFCRRLGQGDQVVDKPQRLVGAGNP